MICRQAIQTKFFGPSNVKGSRIKAQCAAGSVYWYCQDDLDIQDNHFQAACKLLKKLDWDSRNEFAGGGQLKDGTYVWVLKGKNNA